MDTKNIMNFLSCGLILSGFALIYCSSAFAYKLINHHYQSGPVLQTLVPSFKSSPAYHLQANNITSIAYTQADNENNADRTQVKAGGFGGNKGSGKIVYDGLYYPTLTLTREAGTSTCYFYNDAVIVRDNNSRDIVSFSCPETDPAHPGLYWSGDFDAVNDGYSPANDALYAGTVITDMFQKWYKMPPLGEDEDGLPRKITLRIYDGEDNAYWDGLEPVLGNGGSEFYPLTSLDLIAGMISNDICDLHSGLSDSGQSGAIRWAFSSMTAAAVQYFAYHNNDWRIDASIMKSGQALHYMDHPGKDCGDSNPGSWCHIDSAKQYYDGLDYRYACGVYERAFYLLATSPGWNTKKAYDIMLRANLRYWHSYTNFTSGACDVMHAASDLGYDQETVKKAFNSVDIDTSQCASQS